MLVYTVYALSAPITPNVPPAEINRAVLLTAMQGKILAQAEMKASYTRSTELTRTWR